MGPLKLSYQSSKDYQSSKHYILHSAQNPSFPKYAIIAIIGKSIVDIVTEYIYMNNNYKVKTKNVFFFL